MAAGGGFPIQATHTQTRKHKTCPSPWGGVCPRFCSLSEIPQSQPATKCTQNTTDMAGMQARRLRPLLLLLLLLPALAAAFLLQQPNARGRTAAAGGAAALRPLRMAAAAAAVVEKDSRATKAAFERLFVKIANAEGPGQVNAE